MESIDTVRALVDALGGATTVSAAADVVPNTVIWWTHRERIPPEHIDAVVELAKTKKLVGVDHALILRISKTRRPRSPTPQAAA